MSLRIRRTRAAEQDLDDIWLHIAGDNPGAADRMIDALLDAEARLAVAPLMGRARDDLAPGLRAWVVAPYILCYRVDPDDLVIVRVLHGARDLPGLFDDAGPDPA